MIITGKGLELVIFKMEFMFFYFRYRNGRLEKWNEIDQAAVQRKMEAHPDGRFLFANAMERFDPVTSPMWVWVKRSQKKEE